MRHLVIEALFIASGCFALRVIGTMLAEYRHKIVAAVQLEPTLQPAQKIEKA